MGHITFSHDDPISQSQVYQQLTSKAVLLLKTKFYFMVFPEHLHNMQFWGGFVMFDDAKLIFLVKRS